MLFPISSRQCQFFIRRLLCFLYETVEQHHSIPRINVEQDPSNPIVREMRSDFIDSVAYGSARWHSDRPAELDSLDVLSDSPPVIRIWQRLEPLSNWFPVHPPFDRRSPGRAFRIVPYSLRSGHRPSLISLAPSPTPQCTIYGTILTIRRCPKCVACADAARGTGEKRPKHRQERL